MEWVQNYNPLASAVWSPLVAALPILVLSGLLLAGVAAPRAAISERPRISAGRERPIASRTVGATSSRLAGSSTRPSEKRRKAEGQWMMRGT